MSSISSPTIDRQLLEIRRILGIKSIKPKPQPKKEVKQPKVKVSRKWPCTKAKYEWFIKNTALCVADGYADMLVGMDPEYGLSMEDILCDSVDNLLMCDGKGVIWYMVNKLDYDKQWAKDALYDQVYSEAVKIYNKKNKEK